MKGFVYEWTNTENGKKYIGSHKGNLDDGYIGSGLIFRRSYNNNPNNFTRRILYVGENYRQVEEQILQELNVEKNDLYYNLKNTAIGGWDHTHNNKETILKRNLSISKSKKGRRRTKGINDERFGEKNGMFGKKHKTITIQVMKDKALERDYDIYGRGIIILPEKIEFPNIASGARFFDLSGATLSHHIKKGEVIKRGKLKGKKIIYA